MGQKSIVRTISLVLAIPIAMLGTLGGCVGAANLNEHPDSVRLVGTTGDVTFELVQPHEQKATGILNSSNIIKVSSAAK